MPDSIVSPRIGPGNPPRWLVFLHRLPPRPAYLRVKVRRRLQSIGVLPLKNSVYVLPASPDGREDLEWLRREILAEGGEATIVSGQFVAGVRDQELESRFRAQRKLAYRAVTRAARRLGATPSPHDIEALRHRFDHIASRDPEDSPEKESFVKTLRKLEGRRRPRRTAGAPRPAPSPPLPRRIRRGTWITRQDVFIDRIASAWLIARFIDPAARFRFVSPTGYRPTKGEIRFDMFEGEFTHDGDRCTFETLVERFRLREPALQTIGEIVHDIDCKDQKFGRVEAGVIQTVFEGIALAHPKDDARLAAGRTVLDGLYERYRHG